MNLETYCHYLSSTLTGLEIGAQYMARDCVLWRSYFRGQTSCRIDEFRQKVDRVVDPEWYYQDEIRKGSVQLLKDKFVRTFLKILLTVPETQSVGKKPTERLNLHNRNIPTLRNAFNSICQWFWYS